MEDLLKKISKLQNEIFDEAAATASNEILKHSRGRGALRLEEVEEMIKRAFVMGANFQARQTLKTMDTFNI